MRAADAGHVVSAKLTHMHMESSGTSPALYSPPKANHVKFFEQDSISQVSRTNLLLRFSMMYLPRPTHHYTNEISRITRKISN